MSVFDTATRKLIAFFLICPRAQYRAPKKLDHIKPRSSATDVTGLKSRITADLHCVRARTRRKRDEKMKKKKASPRPKPNAVMEFIRLIQRFSHINSRRETKLLEGVSRARANTNFDKYAEIVRGLNNSLIYKNLLAPLKFPASYADFTLTKVYLNNLTTEQTIIWHSCVIGTYSAELSHFVTSQTTFETCLWHGQYDTALLLLAEIEEKFGVSLWFITRKITLLHLMHGAAAQKEYLKEVISTESFNPLAAVIAYYISMLCEDGRSTDQLEEELKESWEHPLFKDFTICHVVPHRINEVSSTANVLAYEEALPLVDRLQSLVNMIQFEVAKNGINKDSYLYTALKSVEQTNDPRVHKLIKFAEADISENKDDEYTKTLDLYTGGNYSEIDTASIDLIELIATRNAHLGLDPKGYLGTSLYERAIAGIHQLLVIPQERLEISLTLRKISLAFIGSSAPFQIAALIQNDQDFIFDDENYVLTKIAAICGRNENPRSWRVFREINTNFDERLAPKTLTGKLYNVLTGSYEDGESILNELPIPEYRKYAYKGHLAFLNNHLACAAENYLAASVCNGDFVRNRAKRYLFKALFKSNRIEDCVSLVANHCIDLPGIESVYPLRELSLKILETPSLNSSLYAAVILHLASRTDPDWERQLSDYFENIMYSCGVDTPSELTIENTYMSREELIFFWRFICVPRTFDDTTIFESPEAIDAERILICQNLIDLDPDNTKIYAAEIKSITRDSQVSQLLQQIQASNIFVDEEGLKLSIEANVRDRFLKYQELTSSPEVDAQSESISKAMEKLISAKSDFKNLSLPATERKSLFSSLLHYFVFNFAMNPAYGLDTHLSTSIRHGKFEGHIRNPIAKHDLLCQSHKGKYLFPDAWAHRLNTLTPEEKESLQKAFERFTGKIESYIDDYLIKRLHIKSDTYSSGLFDLFASDADREKLSKNINIDTTCDEFIDNLFDYCWELTDKSLTNIRAEIDGPLRQNIYNAFDSFLLAVRENISNGNAQQLTDAIINSRADLGRALSSIQSWFKKPIKARHEPFEIDLALDVGKKQITNCYANQDTEIIKKISTTIRFRGQYLSGVVEIIFILLQNVLLHSGYGDSKNTIHIRIDQANDSLRIQVENKLSDTIDLDDRKASSLEAVSKYNQDTALAMARKEGGSGLSKIWRIMEYDLKKESAISLEVTDSRKFRTTLTILNVGDLGC
jgi:hypothetical protein